MVVAESPKLIYIVVVNEGEDGRGSGSFRYTRPVLQSTLQLIGCKPRHAYKISRRAYEIVQSKCSADGSRPDAAGTSVSGLWDGSIQAEPLNLREVNLQSSKGNVETRSSIPFELYKRQTTAFVTRDTFLNLVCDALSEYKYVGPNQRTDLVLACRIRERKESVTILLCGTSGCGKSTLSALLGSRLGITTVISTDSIRHMMRSFVDEKQNPLLWASTYHAGECLDPVAVAQAKAKRKAKKLAAPPHSLPKQELDGPSNQQHDDQLLDTSGEAEKIGKKQMAIEGYKAQSEMVIDSLDRLIFSWEDRKESAVVEGVHLSLNFVMGLMKKHPSVVPFMIYIANEDKHVERFAVRAKYMTLDPARNKYVKYIRNIRTIQEYLSNRANKHLVPKINNTNVDRSVALIHATVFSCLRRRLAGEELYDSTTNTVPIINEEYRKQCTANSMGSKGMFKLIQRQGSSRHLMALFNTDGSVAKAWPVESADGKIMSGNVGKNCLTIYGPLQVGKAEEVNLQFGTFGISAWPSDAGGTSHTGSIDDSKADCIDTGSRYFSSRCSSPRLSEGPAKEHKDDISVPDSEEEAEEESNDDQSDVDKNDIAEELEGSVDEGSTKSDEEFEDLAMQDSQENGYWTDDDEPTNIKKLTSEKKLTRDMSGKIVRGDLTEKKSQNLRSTHKIYTRASDPSCYHSLLAENLRSLSLKTKKHLPTNSLQSYRRSRSIPASAESGL
ncbi:unnamed protein product [Musa acuminata subsp. burmannicoides]